MKLHDSIRAKNIRETLEYYRKNPKALKYGERQDTMLANIMDDITALYDSIDDQYSRAIKYNGQLSKARWYWCRGDYKGFHKALAIVRTAIDKLYYYGCHGMRVCTKTGRIVQAFDIDGIQIVKEGEL